jgi:thioredoxin 1
LRRKEILLLIVTLILIVIGFIFNSSCDNQSKKTADQKTTSGVSPESPGDQEAEKLPMLVDLGKGTCIPCKKMKPILEEMEVEYKGKAIVRVIDLRYEPKEADKYKIRLIPTQIFFDREGKEVFRHEGFMDKPAIKAKFAEMGVY